MLFQRTEAEYIITHPTKHDSDESDQVPLAYPEPLTSNSNPLQALRGTGDMFIGLRGFWRCLGLQLHDDAP